MTRKIDELKQIFKNAEIVQAEARAVAIEKAFEVVLEGCSEVARQARPTYSVTIDKLFPRGVGGLDPERLTMCLIARLNQEGIDAERLKTARSIRVQGWAS